MTHISQFILHSNFQCAECNVAFRVIKTFLSEFFQTFWKGPEEDIWDAAVPLCNQTHLEPSFLCDFDFLPYWMNYV